ncbi:DUF3718 domain-containing protein [Pseudoalteromonas denitrificans]|uniref:DUF3718 domain-containing protein n=1 Tax=Pseudoalteromonas denitrificans DSM 6059 TaxID=1123010 RepID=A0A1I1E5A9_9GAMM|nr:DUF3718 domain-containing protein [Pseudoalteromonas denitrificans]SFB80100.1 Protein of unknown function [Pseudoalteromonas denitrificans DSM 6059]
MKFKTTLVLSTLMSASIFVSMPTLANEQLAASLCDYVAADDKSRLRKKIKESRVKLRNIFSGVTCSGNNLLRHAMVNNADGTGQFMVKKLPKALLAAGGDVDWANSNGHSASPIVASIKARAGI